ncbi:hypothetical protein [Mycobacterium deserti]|uniref:Uncharacterized protein n=1 Tax=Mycobacterium deserti TaxID=2978347 RepID=A0ABT2M8C8_9MYCO|nr:hypothetical protein [Mycobacterium deserti]MCT7657864.1 hypothetical protein [Mycobacterium deserti]
MVAVVLAIAVAFFGIRACQNLNRDPHAASLPPAFGVRITDGELRIWTGAPCRKVNRVTVNFSSENARLVLMPPPGEWAVVEYFNLNGPYPGLNVVEQLPDGFDWRASQTIDLWMDAGEGAGSTPSNIAEIVDGSAQHPDDTFWFQGVGWLGPADVKAQDGKTFLSTCTPDPAETPSLPVAFGARVTDGKLHLWTGSPCDKVNGVTLEFKPDATKPDHVDLALGKAGDAMVQLEHFTLGDPVPGLKVTEALPEDFDWREQQSLTLSVHSLGPHELSETDLVEVIEGSTAHPDDTYWFQGVGWLNPAQVVEQNGKTFLATCTPDPKK